MKQFCKAKTRESVSSGCAACEIHPVMKMEVDRYCPIGMPDSAFKMPNHSAFRKRIDSRVTLSNSRNAVSFSSACTTNRFPSPRCASAIQIMCPSVSIAETQPKLQPALLRLSEISYQYFTLRDVLFGQQPHRVLFHGSSRSSIRLLAKTLILRIQFYP